MGKKIAEKADKYFTVTEKLQVVQGLLSSNETDYLINNLPSKLNGSINLIWIRLKSL